MATKNQTNNESANVQNAQVSNPMMKQFRDLKVKHPDAILLFRCGDFYESYEEDAKAVAEVCGITLTQADGTTMAGFPHHALSNYLPKLIRAGKRVAMCDQLEKPKPTAKSEEEKPKAETKAEEPKAEKPKAIKPKTTKPKSEKPKAKAKANDEKPKLIYETYTSKKGKTCARIKGFSEGDTIYQNAEDIHASKTWERDKKGNKTFMLVFGPVYAAAAKQLCDAINSGKKEDVAPALAAIENALTTHRKEREEKRAEYKAKKAANTTTKSEGCYTKEDVAAMLQKVMAGEDIPEEIKSLLKAA